MGRGVWVGLSVLLLVASGCGTESATGTRPDPKRLAKGESVLAAVSWSNTVEMGGDNETGTYLSVARGKGDKEVVWPVVTDIGTTAKVSLTAWCLKFPA